MVRKYNKFREISWEILDMFSSVVMISLLLFILYYSMSYFTGNYPSLRAIDAQAFYIAVGIAIVTTIAQWIEGRIKAIMKSTEKIKYIRSLNKDGTRKKTKRTTRS